MSKIVSHARQLRLEYAAKLGRAVSIREVAERIGVDRRVVMKIESGDMQRVDTATLERLAALYHEAGIDSRHILEYDPDGQRNPGHVAALPAFST